MHHPLERYFAEFDKLIDYHDLQSIKSLQRSRAILMGRQRVENQGLADLDLAWCSKVMFQVCQSSKSIFRRLDYGVYGGFMFGTAKVARDFAQQ